MKTGHGVNPLMQKIINPQFKQNPINISCCHLWLCYWSTKLTLVIKINPNKSLSENQFQFFSQKFDNILYHFKTFDNKILKVLREFYTSNFCWVPRNQQKWFYQFLHLCSSITEFKLKSILSYCFLLANSLRRSAYIIVDLIFCFQVGLAD